MSSLRPESHVAQQIRREKLRIQNSSQQIHEFPNNLEQLSLHPGFNLDLLQVRNVRNNANMLDERVTYSTSQVPNFSTASNPLEYHQELGAADHQQCEIRNLGNWRNSAPNQGSENWFVNYAHNANSFMSSELNNVSSYNELMNVQCSNNNNPPPSSPIYHNALQDIVKSASISSQRQDVASNSMMQQSDHNIWVGNLASEVELQPQQQPSYENQLRFPQTLSLSLSSNASSQQGSASEDPQGLGYMNVNVKPSIVSRDCGKSSLLESNISYRNVGPLGPFTGYATILKSSRFLKSAQQLLEEICGAKFGKSHDVSERVSPEVSASTSADAFAAKDSYNSGSSSSMLYNISKESSVDGGVDGRSSFGVSSRPDYQHKKAKLLYMQEEVTRQCKQYHLQMQMVVSSFESVVGLSSATPYIPMALKSVSKHFRCLKSSISDQLKRISEALGDDLSIPLTTSTTSTKADTNMAKMIRCMDQSFLKNNNPGSGTTELVEPQQHVWRPQRGLPERAVAILKAWLFEHFLHPYPTDTDKHMLASQTGLSRNQVSNWFINARVRVWKPMVEEIHMLETKSTSSKDKSGKNEGTFSGIEKGDTSQPNKPLRNIAMNSIPENQFQSMEIMGSSIAANANSEEWSQEKRSKLECQMTSSNIDGTMMGFVPYRRGGIEVTGLGSVSLTLGLRHGVEGVQQHQHHLQEEHLRHHHLGVHTIHDFVG